MIIKETTIISYTCQSTNTYTWDASVGISFLFLISNFRRVLNVVCFLLGNSPASEFYMPTFQNTLFQFHRQVGVKNTYLPMKMEQSVLKRRHIKFRCQ
jgi:hypothetical protein